MYAPDQPQSEDAAAAANMPTRVYGAYPIQLPQRRSATHAFITLLRFLSCLSFFGFFAPHHTLTPQLTPCRPSVLLFHTTVGNLPWIIDESALRDAFKHIGEIGEVKVSAKHVGNQLRLGSVF